MVREQAIQLWAAAAAVGLAGCAGTNQARYDALAADLGAARPDTTAPRDGAAALEKLEGRERLDRSALVGAVLARNPDVEAARQAWRAALAEYPQVTSLEDPTVSYTIAPLSIGADDVDAGHQVTVGQRLPWPGKLSLAGEIALAEADAARHGYEAARLGLGLAASALFDRYYANARSLELNEEHRELMEDIREVALALFEAGTASQQDALQAEVELAHVVHQRVVLETAREVIVARLNGLLHRPPQAPLPPPPGEIEPFDIALEEPAALQEEALRRRPEIEGHRVRIEGREAGVELAKTRYYPDLAVNGSWNSMWSRTEHQWMIGVSVDVPIQLSERRAAVDEAEARLHRARSKLASSADEVRVEVVRARERLEEALHVVELYQERLVPAAEAQIEAARSAYESGEGGFQALIDAERTLRNLELEYQQALADLGLRRAALERAVGKMPGRPGEGVGQ